MTMTDKTPKPALSEAELDRLFEAGRTARPEPSGGLMARILADAEVQAQAQAVRIAVPPAPVRRRGWLGRALAEIGGWPAAAGLAAAAVAGLTIGVVSPGALDSLSGGYLSVDGTQADDLLPSYAILLGEG